MNQPLRQRRFEWDKTHLARARSRLKEMTGRKAEWVLSSPGRTELGGNHTDHNRGKVLAASIHLDMVSAVARRQDGVIRIFSEGFRKPFVVDTKEPSPRKNERGTSTSLIRGIVAAFRKSDLEVGGFDAAVLSRVGVGSGLSSSASFEVLIGAILNSLFNGGRVGAVTAAIAGQFAENRYFGKPCGLMDQLACSVGGTLRIDFRKPEHPRIDRITMDPRKFGFDLVVVNTGTGHEDLTEEYAGIPREMRSVARFLGVQHCREIPRNLFFRRLPEIRKRCGDRAVLRCQHFFEENDRVDRQFRALKRGRFTAFLELVQRSGDSSAKYLQNISSPRTPRHQALSVALAETERFLSHAGAGASRVHGGGFAGTIQAYIPLSHVGGYRKVMERLFGRGAVQVLHLRPQGVQASRI